MQNPPSSSSAPKSSGLFEAAAELFRRIDKAESLDAKPGGFKRYAEQDGDKHYWLLFDSGPAGARDEKLELATQLANRIVAGYEEESAGDPALKIGIVKPNENEDKHIFAVHFRAPADYTNFDPKPYLGCLEDLRHDALQMWGDAHIPEHRHMKVGKLAYEGTYQEAENLAMLLNAVLSAVFAFHHGAECQIFNPVELVQHGGQYFPAIDAKTLGELQRLERGSALSPGHGTAR